MIKIVTDSGIDFPHLKLEEMGIFVSPGSMVFGNEVIEAFTELTSAQFFERLEAADDLPRQRDSSMLDFRKIYREITKETPDATILSLHVSEALATTINAARQAAAGFPMTDIRLFDTKFVSMGQGLMVWEAARMAQEEADVGAILRRMADMRERMGYFFIVDTLEYLAKGGRVGAVQHVFGRLLDIKPVLTVKNGLVESFDSQRSRERALEALHDLVVERAGKASGLRLGVAHAVCEEDAKEMSEKLQKALDVEHSILAEIGPTVGAHAGPGALGVAWYAPESDDA